MEPGLQWDGETIRVMGWWKFWWKFFFSDTPPRPHLMKSCGHFQGRTDEGDLAERAATHVPSWSAGDSYPPCTRKALYIMMSWPPVSKWYVEVLQPPSIFTSSACFNLSLCKSSFTFQRYRFCCFVDEAFIPKALSLWWYTCQVHWWIFGQLEICKCKKTPLASQTNSNVLSCDEDNLKGLSASGKSNWLKNYRLSTKLMPFWAFFEMFFRYFDNLLFPNLRVSAVSAELKVAGIGRSGPVPAPEMWKSECPVLEARHFCSNSKFLALEITFQARKLFLILLFILMFQSVLWFFGCFLDLLLVGLACWANGSCMGPASEEVKTPEAYTWKEHSNWNSPRCKLSHAIKPMWCILYTILEFCICALEMSWS